MNITLPMLALLLFIPFFSAAKSSYIFISPLPGSNFHPTQTSIILRTAEKWENNCQEVFNFNVQGNVSGLHQCRFRLSADQFTLIVTPVSAFAPAEKVTVEIVPVNNNLHEKFTFHFFTSPWDAQTAAIKLLEYYNGTEILMNKANTGLAKTSFNNLEIDINTNPEPGSIFIRNSSTNSPENRFTLITDHNNTNPLFSLQDANRGYCFQLQKNGYLSLFNLDSSSWEILDSSYKIIDTVYCANGYKADLHDFIITRDGHYFLMAYDPQPVDMSEIVQGGHTNATVTGLILQELDENKNLIFQWRSWDHFEITDAIHQDLTRPNIDYVHANSLDIDIDGNIILSSRHLDEVSKISTKTAQFIWRMGGVHNQFTFIGDSTGFNYQHDARKINNGNLTIFDNGNYHREQLSAAKEYKLDEDLMTATLVWKYTHPDKIFARAMGNAQRLPGGNTWINWGLVRNGEPAITEVKPDGTIVWQAKFANNDNAYRSYKFNWQSKISSAVDNNDDLSETETINIFPNPAKNVFTISGNFSGILQITDITGKLIFSQDNFAFRTTVDISKFPAGVYNISVHTNTKKYTSKLIKL